MLTRNHKPGVPPVISSELPRVITMADRAVVMHVGRVTAVLERGDIGEHALMSYATGNIAE